MDVCLIKGYNLHSKPFTSNKNRVQHFHNVLTSVIHKYIWPMKQTPMLNRFAYKSRLLEHISLKSNGPTRLDSATYTKTHQQVCVIAMEQKNNLFFLLRSKSGRAATESLKHCLQLWLFVFESEFFGSIFKGTAVTSHSCRLRGSRPFFYFTACFSEDRPLELKCDQQQSEGHLFRLIWFFCLIVQFIHVADEMVPLVSSAVPLSLRWQNASTSCLACVNRARHWREAPIQFSQTWI